MRQRAEDAQSYNLISWRIDPSDSDTEDEVEDTVVAATRAGVLRNMNWYLLWKSARQASALSSMRRKAQELIASKYELQDKNGLGSSSSREARKALFVTKLEYWVYDEAFRRYNLKDCFSLYSLGLNAKSKK